jgi:hypothetical protein
MKTRVPKNRVAPKLPNKENNTRYVSQHSQNTCYQRPSVC